MKGETLNSTQLLDDEAIRLLLMDSDAREQERGFTELFNHAKRPLAEMLLDKFQVLSSDEHAEIINTSFLDLHRSLKSNNVDLERPLVPLLFRITACRAKDYLRAKRAKKRSHIDFHADISKVLDGDNYAIEWRSTVSAGKYDQIAERFYQFMPQLKSLPLYVAQAIAHGMPDELSDEDLCDEIESITGRRYSILSVKDARQEVRKQFRQFLPGG
jgi:DNA-directed RNA polymerase specialized sigma24 family protein